MTDTTIARAVDVPDLSLGQAIELLRRPTGLSARALSLAAGLSESYVGKVEKGEIEPSLRAFAYIARTLGLSAREIHVLVVRGSEGGSGMNVATIHETFDAAPQSDVESAKRRLERLMQGPTPSFGCESIRRADALVEALTNLQTVRYELLLGAS